MQFHSNELFLLYNPQSTMGKQTKALALDICSHINAVDAVHEKLCQTPTDIMRLGGAVSQGDKVLPHLKKYH